MPILAMLLLLQDADTPARRDLAAVSIAWQSCVKAAAEQYAVQPEPADTVAKGAIAKCDDFRPKMRDAASAYFAEGGFSKARSQAAVDSLVAERQTILERYALSWALDARAKK